MHLPRHRFLGPLTAQCCGSGWGQAHSINRAHGSHSPGVVFLLVQASSTASLPGPQGKRSCPLCHTPWHSQGWGAHCFCLWCWASSRRSFHVLVCTHWVLSNHSCRVRIQSRHKPVLALGTRSCTVAMSGEVVPVPSKGSLPRWMLLG